MAEKLRTEIREIQAMRQAQENELATIDNAALRQRFQGALDQLIAREQEKREEVYLLTIIRYVVNSLQIKIVFSFSVRTSDGPDGIILDRASINGTRMWRTLN